MRFAGDVDFEIRNGDDLALAFATFERYVKSSLPVGDATSFTLKLMFDAEGSTIREVTYRG